jgi:hypothetical protein
MNPVVALLTLGVSLAFALGLNAVDAPPADMLALIPLLITLLFPWRTLRHTMVPLGQVRAAHLTARLVDVGFGNDAAGGAVMAATMALLHKTNASDDDLRWVEEQLAAATPLRAGGLVAAALLRLRAGDRAGARQLLRSVELLRFPGSPLLAFRAAREFLAADAAERGAWDEVAALAALPGALHASRATLFLGAVAGRLLRRDDAPSDERLWLLWLLAPARRRTRPLLHRALTTPRGSSVTSVAPPAEAPAAAAAEDPLQAALALQVGTWQTGAPSLRGLARLGEAWDRALDDKALERRLLLRSMELGTHEASKLREQLREAVAAQLAEQARSRGLALGAIEAPGPTLERAARLLRDGLLTTLEAGCEATRLRAIDKRALPAPDEWREWLVLRERYEQLHALAGGTARRLAWPRVRDDVCKLAVWLWNERGEKTIAHAIFRWLLDEATELQDADSIELHRKNVDCGTG